MQSVNKDHAIKKIGIFYDGNYFFHVSNYYNYEHRIKARISVNGLHQFAKSYIGHLEDCDPKYCKIVSAHYFRGRLNSYEAQQNNKLFNERVFEDILMAEGITTHYLPLRTNEGRREEKGVDIWLALEAYELSLHKQFDVVVLVACDGDYVPLIRKLSSLGIRVMVLGWDFEFTDSRTDRVRTTVTSSDLLAEATYPVPMHGLIESTGSLGEFMMEDLFVKKSNVEFQDQPVIDPDFEPEQIGDRERSYVLTLKNGYGFIAKPPNNLFFHWTEVLNSDFGEMQVNDMVEYSVAQNDRGQDIAIKVDRIFVEDEDGEQTAEQYEIGSEQE